MCRCYCGVCGVKGLMEQPVVGAPDGRQVQQLLLGMTPADCLQLAVELRALPALLGCDLPAELPIVLGCGCLNRRHKLETALC